MTEDEKMLKEAMEFIKFVTAIHSICFAILVIAIVVMAIGAIRLDLKLYGYSVDAVYLMVALSMASHWASLGSIHKICVEIDKKLEKDQK